MSNGVVVAAAGAKGGVGKTTTSINLSAVLAEVGWDVVLVELDLAMANVADFLDLDVRLEHGRDSTLHDVLSGNATVADATYEAPGGFDVIPSGVTLSGFARADLDMAKDVVIDARSKYDVVVLDTASGLGKVTMLPLSLADETVLVSSPHVASVRDTKKTRDLVRHTGGNVAGIVFVKSGSGRSPSVDRIATHLSVDLLGHVPDDSAVVSAQDIGRPVVVARTDSNAAETYRAVGSHLHERIVRLRANLTRSERETEDAREEVDTTDADETPLSTTDETTDEGSFRFVDGSSETEDENTGAVTPESTEETGADTESAVDDTFDALSGGYQQDDEAETTTTTTEDRQHRPGEQNDSAADPTDDQRDQTDPADPAGPAFEWLASDHQSSNVSTPADTDTSATPREDDDSWSSKQATTKRFLDRAINLVDRKND